MTVSKDKVGSYANIILKIFEAHFSHGVDSFVFDREEIVEASGELGIAVPKNLGDVVYSFRYRNALPEKIADASTDGKEWIIEGAGRGKYRMKLVKRNRIVPRSDLLAIKIPDATPELLSQNAQNDEQALLAKVRYNRLVDLFLGVVAYSLQNHLRTTVKKLGQIEIDEVYLAVDRSGVQYVVPVQAKSGKDMHSVVQTKQDMACCAERFPRLVCRAVSAQFTDEGVIALFELVLEGDEIKVAREKHYKLVPADSIAPEELRGYRLRSN